MSRPDHMIRWSHQVVGQAQDFMEDYSKVWNGLADTMCNEEYPRVIPLEAPDILVPPQDFGGFLLNWDLG